MYKLWIQHLVLLMLLSALIPGMPKQAKAQQTYSVSQADRVDQQAVSEQLPRTVWQWEQKSLDQAAKSADPTMERRLLLTGETDMPFTGLAIGWKIDEDHAELLPASFSFKIRSSARDGEWSDRVRSYGYLAPDDSPSNYYWAMLYVTQSGAAHHRFEIEMTLPAEAVVTDLKISGADARLTAGSDTENVQAHKMSPASEEMPEIILREGWWGDLPPSELEPGYTPTQIEISHALVHHTVTANEPANPPQVIRQIWDWHVNDNGWLDIGYNFLFDHEGNLYQGRYNPDLMQTDVQGAHAGAANSRSTGIALLGQFEPGASPQPGHPQMLALDALVKVISWRFTQRQIDPMGNGMLAGNYLPAISGHRDVSATACPGENLYTLLPGIRHDTRQAMGDAEDPVADHPFELHQNYPNPFRDETIIAFSADAPMRVQIDLYTVSGQKVAEIFNGQVEEGDHEIPYRADGLSSGVYFYELVSGSFRVMKQMIHIR
jgi:hypothetical protein